MDGIECDFCEIPGNHFESFFIYTIISRGSFHRSFDQAGTSQDF